MPYHPPFGFPDFEDTTHCRAALPGALCNAPFGGQLAARAQPAFLELALEERDHLSLAV
jgi:hypothetical protein